MALIESIRGKAQTPVGGITYSFDRDRAGRYVCEVGNPRHASILISAGTYRAVDPVAPATATIPDANEDQTAAKLIGQAERPKILQGLSGQGQFFTLSPWPGILACPTAELKKPPPFVALEADDGITITTDNGVARYAFVGTAGDQTVFKLKTDPAATYSVYGGGKPQGIAGEDDDEDEGAAPTDDLTEIKGIGDAVAKQLNDAGVTTFQHLAELTEEGVTALEAKLAKGNIVSRFGWVQAARALLTAKAAATPATA